MLRRTLTYLLLISALLLAGLGGATAAAPVADWRTKVDPWVLNTAATGQTEFLVFLADQADTRGAAALPDKGAKGAFVYQTLAQHAERTQAPVRRALARLGVAWRPYWVVNAIWVQGDAAVVQALAERADVAHVYANPTVRLDLPAIEAGNAALLDAVAAPEAPTAVEWGVAKINADDVWAAGANGAGVVIGGQDTGYRWTHNALKGKYRGWNGVTANHDYNWHDAIHTIGSSCGANAVAPCDDHGHGTHTMGTMVGDDGAGNQVGVAPGARWIGCRNMDRGNGTPATYMECYQWFIAPTKIDGSAPDPSKAPDVINNSWGCPASEGCTDPNALLTVVQNVRAAGIVTVHSAGNEGSACSTVSAPAAIYAASFSVGATNNEDAIASFSSRGPVTADGSGRLKPNVAAPGVSVRSAAYSTDSAYTTMSGTSMAGPHVAGLVALVIDGNEALRGDVDAIETLVEQSALDKTTTQGCGGDSPTAVPNNVFGWGRVDALAAYQVATAPCVAPAAVTNVAISAANASQVSLTWPLVAGAVQYYVSWDDAPYFAPPPICDAGKCISQRGATFVHPSLGSPATHTIYRVRSVAACGAAQSASAPVGEFEFALAPGQP